MKAAVKGTTITEADAQEIITGVQGMYDRIPGLFKPMIPALPEVLRRIPPNAQKYTLRELIELLDYAYQNGMLKK